MGRDDLVVWCGAKPVARLREERRDRLALVYDDRWAESDRAVPVSVSLPVAGGSYAGGPLANVLWGLLPDNERVLDRWARDYQCSASDLFGLLANVGGDVAGAMQYVPEGHAPEEAETGGVELLSDTEIAALLREVREDSAAWHPRSRGRWSLAGAQGKIALFRDRDGCWGQPSGRVPTTHILKPAIAGHDNHDLNEHLCLATAGLLGLPVAETTVERFEDESALVVRRFDRVVEPDGSVRRFHQEDCCQALAIHPARKYQNDGGPSVEDLAAVLRDAVLPNPAEAVHTLVLAVAFNWLILGTDAHAKNYGLLLEPHRVGLAPLYDVASNAVYGEHPKKLRLAQKVDGEYRPAVLARASWERLARAVRVPPDSIIDDIRRYAATLPEAMSEVIAVGGWTPEVATAARRMRDAIATWVEVCRHTLDR